jgi:hypothetical protein
MELTFTREDIPKITRAGGSGREAEAWETHLAPLKDTPNESFRVWTYDKRTSAVSRMSSVRERLTKAVPGENWNLAVRSIPGTAGTTHPEGTVDADGKSIAGESAEQFGVYVAYVGTFTDEQIAENARLHKERSERVRNARAAAEAARAAAGNGSDTSATDTTSTTDTPSDGMTAKERVAAAKQRQTASA